MHVQQETRKWLESGDYPNKYNDKNKPCKSHQKSKQVFLKLAQNELPVSSQLIRENKYAAQLCQAVVSYQQCEQTANWNI